MTRDRYSTSGSISAWSTPSDVGHVTKKSDTNGKLTKDVVLISGRLVSNRGVNEVVISVEPTAVNRKLAIRDLNGRLQGKTIKSNTFAREN